MRKYFMIILFLSYATLSSCAQGETMDGIAEREEVLLVKSHMINGDGSYKHPELRYESVRAIDGKVPAIEIANVGYIQMPPSKQTMEIYNGR